MACEKEHQKRKLQDALSIQQQNLFSTTNVPNHNKKQQDGIINS